ncbi:unnamed protein product [Phytophthora lilii]|uniref:Unnamed protein product n=1 Tax=Phytophthora lilii TaxID=2077276 RepID=A0A9W6TP45_9STRA|nr:unnamed protein product [Phytophthora lilii]
MDALLEQLYYNPETGFISANVLHKKAKEIDSSITLKQPISKKLVKSVLKNYNNTWHSSINTKPIQAKGVVMEGDLNHNRELMERLENELAIGATVLYRLDKGAFDKEKARWSKTVYEIVGIDGYRVQIRSKNRHTLYKALNDIKVFKSKATDAKVGKNQVFEAEELLDHKKMKNGKLKYFGLDMMIRHGNLKSIYV